MKTNNVKTDTCSPQPRQVTFSTRFEVQRLAQKDFSDPVPVNHRKTHYAITPDKLNLVQVQRNVNEVRMKYPTIPEHLLELYSLDEKKRHAQEQLLKTRQEEDKKLAYSFKPQIDTISEQLTRNNPVEVVERNMEWMRRKEQKLDEKRELRREVSQEIERRNMQHEELPKARYDVKSKLKQYLDEGHYRRGHSPPKYTKARSQSPMAPSPVKKPISSRLNIHSRFKSNRP